MPDIGSSVGGIVFPLMLNKLLSQSSVGYAWSIRYTGFLCLGLLVIANGLMRARLLPTRAKEVSTTKQTSLKAIFSDIPYDLMIFGYVNGESDITLHSRRITGLSFWMSAIFSQVLYGAFRAEHGD